MWVHGCNPGPGGWGSLSGPQSGFAHISDWPWDMEMTRARDSEEVGGVEEEKTTNIVSSWDSPNLSEFCWWIGLNILQHLRPYDIMLALTLSSLQSKVSSNLLFWLPIFSIICCGQSFLVQDLAWDLKNLSGNLANSRQLSPIAIYCQYHPTFLGFSEGNLSLALDKGLLGLKVLAVIFESLNLQCKKQQ